MGADVAAPFNISVRRIGKITDLQHQQDILSGDDVDDRFQQRTYIPGDPLLSRRKKMKRPLATPTAEAQASR